MSDRRGSPNTKRTLLIIVASAIGLVLLYLTFRDISRHDLAEGLAQMKPAYLVPGFLVMALGMFVRALRFGVILKPFCNLELKDLWDLLNLWGAMNMVLPARLAEFVRPYLLKRRGVSFSMTLGAVMVERIFDLCGLLVLLAVVLWRSPGIPSKYTLLGEIMLICLVVVYVVILAILRRREWFDTILGKLVSHLPPRAAEFLRGTINRLLDGVGIMAHPLHALLVFVYSVAIWLSFSVLTYLFLMAFGIEAPFLVAVTIQVVLCIGAAVPSAPGFIGTFHAACRIALAIFGVQATIAVPFATAYHLFSVLGSILLGLLSYWTGTFRFDHGLFGPVDNGGDETVSAETAAEASVPGQGS
ncbi:MAG: lysylphosphatidylglycerol synthase transmembrane domain-containing protein [Thermodesulfobacteriota bacterium]